MFMKQKLLHIKMFLLVSIMAMLGTNAWATAVSLSGGSHDGSAITWTVTDGTATAVTVKQLKGAGNAVNASFISAPRVYRANLLSFEASDGYAITNISITYSGSYKGSTITSGTVMSGNDVTSNTTDITQTLATANNGTHTFASTSTSGLSAIYIQNGTTSSVNTQLRITSIDVTFVSTGGTTKTETTTSFATSSYSLEINSAQYSSFTGQTATVSAGGSAVSGASVTYSSSDAAVASVDASTGAVTLGTKVGTATITATYAGDDDYSGSSASYTITLTYPYVHAGTQADPFTVEEAYAKAQEIGTTAAGPWYVKGIVAQVDEVNLTHGNAQYWISDDGTTSGKMLEIYRGKYLENAAFTSSDQIQVADEVVVTGNLVNYNNTTPEFGQGNYLVSLSRGGLADAEFAFSPDAYTVVLGNSFAAPTLSTAAGYDGTPAYSSSDTGVATVDANSGAVTIVGVGTAVITASAAATSNFLAGEASYTLTVVNKLSPELTVDPTSLTVTVGAADGTVSVSTASGYAGTVTVSSDNTSVATASYSAGTITVTYGNIGTATLTVTAPANGDYEAQTQTIAVTVNDVSGTLWEEDFSSYSANDVPSGGTYSYVSTDGTSVTKIYSANLAEGTSPEILVGKGGGSFAATVPLNGYYGTFTLTYNVNNTNLTISSSVGTVGAATNVSGKTYQIEITDVPEGTSAITITFANEKSGNTRLDNIVLEGTTKSSGAVVAPLFNPASGAIVAGTDVTISSDEGTTLKYTVDGTDPSTSGTATVTATNSATVTVTAPTTIRAIAVDGSSNESTEATATYTMVVPSPEFSPVAGPVAAGTEVTITATGAASIKYTTDGTEPSAANGTVYSDPIEINSNTTLKAVAFDSYGNAGDVVTAEYTIRIEGNITLNKQLVFIPDNSGMSGSSYASNNTLETLSGTWDGDAATTEFTGFTFTDAYAPTQAGVHYFQLKANTGEMIFPTIISDYGFDVTIDYAVNQAVVTIDEVEATGTSATSAKLKIATGTNYCRINSITLTPRTDVKISVTLAEVELGEGKVYAGTYYNAGSAYIMPAGMTGYTITAAEGEGGTLTINPIYAEGSEVPAGEPLLIGSPTQQNNVSATIVSAPTATKSATNLLKGSPGTNVMISGDSDHYYYKLSKSKTTGTPGFFWGNSTGEPFMMTKATSCYLEVAKPTSGEPMKGFSFGTDFTTAISLVQANGGTMPKAVYDLQGRRVAKVQKGIYIVNGKKVMVK